MCRSLGTEEGDPVAVFGESDRDAGLAGVRSYKVTLGLVVCTLFEPRNYLSFRVEPKFPRIS